MNQAFSYSSLKGQIRPRDFVDENLNDEQYLNTILRNAVTIAENCFGDRISTQEIRINGKKGYKTTSLEEKLILRIAVKNLYRSVETSFSHRDQIASELACFLKDGVKYRVYRFDIKSFFESIKIVNIQSSLDSILKLSPHTKDIITAYFSIFQQQFSAPGIPRGSEISPIISDLMLLNFDKKIRGHKDVFYYTRYVDDMLLITSAQEKKTDFISWFQEQLPTDLCLNEEKQTILTVEKKTKRPKSENKIDFLGYQYLIGHPQTTEIEFRPISIDLTDKKIKGIKTKIARSFYNFNKNSDFRLLKDRIAFLASNRDVINSKNKRIGTGVYYSHKKIDPNLSLKSEIDHFLRQNTLSTSYGLTQEQRDILLKLSFYRGFQKRIHKQYSPKRLMEISKIWK